MVKIPSERKAGQTLPANVNINRTIMKIIKRILLTILILTTVGILFRGWFYRHLITYKSVGHRTNYSATDNKLVDLINASADRQTDPDIEQIIKLGLSITSRQLNFTTNKNDTDPKVGL